MAISNDVYWVLFWVAMAALILVRHRHVDWGVGLVLTYIISFSAIHLLIPIFNLLPWYQRSTEFTGEGLRMSAFAVTGFWIGTELVSHVTRRRGKRVEARTSEAMLAPKLVTLYLVSGTVLYGLVSPLLSGVATISAVVSTGATLMAVAVALKCWNAWHARRPVLFALWTVSVVLFPALTVATQGFLGYGFAAALLVLIFITSFRRPGLKEVALGILAAYMAMSIYVTYMRDRSDIRAVVWGGASMQDRVNRLADTAGRFEWFDPTNFLHLERLSRRLDQDYLIGAAIVNLREGITTFARGATLVDAGLALIPRALWTNKPIIGGSGDMVSLYTGFRFADGTSVGAGQVLEFYVNFGTAGVIVGFILVGALVTYVDRRSGEVLLSGDLPRFILWYLPGVSLLQVGGSLSEIVAAAGASVVLAVSLGWFLLHFMPTPRLHVGQLSGAPLAPDREVVP